MNAGLSSVTLLKAPHGFVKHTASCSCGLNLWTGIMQVQAEKGKLKGKASTWCGVMSCLKVKTLIIKMLGNHWWG